MYGILLPAVDVVVHRDLRIPVRDHETRRRCFPRAGRRPAEAERPTRCRGRASRAAGAASAARSTSSCLRLRSPLLNHFCQWTSRRGDAQNLHSAGHGRRHDARRRWREEVLIQEHPKGAERVGRPVEVTNGFAPGDLAGGRNQLGIDAISRELLPVVRPGLAGAGPRASRDGAGERLGPDTGYGIGRAGAATAVGAGEASATNWRNGPHATTRTLAAKSRGRGGAWSENMAISRAGKRRAANLPFAINS